jgi:hypothetical protein
MVKANNKTEGRMKIKKAKWQRKLTVKQIKHIKETTDSGTLSQLKFNLAHHAKARAEGKREPCWECKEIARTLGLLKEG